MRCVGCYVYRVWELCWLSIQTVFCRRNEWELAVLSCAQFKGNQAQAWRGQDSGLYPASVRLVEMNLI